MKRMYRRIRERHLPRQMGEGDSMAFARTHSCRGGRVPHRVSAHAEAPEDSSR
jgi:hypothetical protein